MVFGGMRDCSMGNMVVVGHGYSLLEYNQACRVGLPPRMRPHPPESRQRLITERMHAWTPSRGRSRCHAHACGDALPMQVKMPRSYNKSVTDTASIQTGTTTTSINACH